MIDVLGLIGYLAGVLIGLLLIAYIIKVVVTTILSIGKELFKWVQ